MVHPRVEGLLSLFCVGFAGALKYDGAYGFLNGV